MYSKRKPMLEYTVKDSNSIGGIIKQVNSLLTEGWELHGSIFVTEVIYPKSGSIYTRYTQSLTREIK